MKTTIMAISSLVFAVVAVLHFLRAVYGLPIVMGNFLFPVWASYPASFFAAVLAFFNWKYRR